MKVALLSDCYLPRLGGIEVQVHDLAAQLRARGHEVEVFTATPGSHGERHGFIETIDGTRVHRMALRLPWELPVNPLAPPEVRRRLRDGGFDVAHVHMGVVSPFATDMADAALEVGLPTAITWHCLVERSRPLFRLTGHARRWHRRGAALSAVSAVTAASVHGIVGGRPRVEVLPNGIDVGLWAPPHPRVKPAGVPVHVVAAMRLAARKRPIAVLEVAAAAREIVPAGIPFTLELMGEGPELPRLQHFARTHHMESWLRLPGRVSRTELRQRYWQSDLYLTPARLEAFGIAALEARTSGLPILARSGTGVADFVDDGVHGILAEDDDALAEALAMLVVDDRLRTDMACHSATMPPAQAWPSVLDLVEAEYARAGAGG
ncbi:glycosyltransferase family 4 protein [Knoellia sp. 3-2P3]|uniref:glycosyltransferase family 4 protein n=1 Tax=unclassified Knoellia TaxID=2618719 RepID=UPI0023DA65F8|nr:glycosyltransferase family 4 protein [Knoellia sp. 3-2P3]MDF2093840.1 glycosyltransferase family 4 protein [Knoellia sp. 3-2P3]